MRAAAGGRAPARERRAEHPGVGPVSDHDATQIWRRCEDCGRNFRLSDRPRHLATHVERPSEEAMTLPEVAAATGFPLRKLQKRVQAGKVASFTTGDGVRKKQWVYRDEVTRL